MSEREQIERLVRQRNALWRLIDEFISAHGSGESDDFLKDGDRPEVSCEIEDGKILVVVDNVLEELSNVRFEIDSLDDRLNEIIGNTYIVEGVNYRTGEATIEEERNHSSFEPYFSAIEEPWW